MKRFDTYQERLPSGPPGFSPGKSAPFPTLSRYSRKPVVPQPTSHTPRPSPDSSTNPREKARGSRALQSLRDRWRPHPSLWQPVSATQSPQVSEGQLRAGGLRDRSPRGRAGRSAAVAVVIGRHAQALGRRGRIQRLWSHSLFSCSGERVDDGAPDAQIIVCSACCSSFGSGHVATAGFIPSRQRYDIGSVSRLHRGKSPSSAWKSAFRC